VMYAGEVCEHGPAEAVIADPKHPYTRALLNALPRVDAAPGARLEAIPGELPDPAHPPFGCPFASRCPFVMDVCRAIDPPQCATSGRPGARGGCGGAPAAPRGPRLSEALRRRHGPALPLEAGRPRGRRRLVRSQRGRDARPRR